MARERNPVVRQRRLRELLGDPVEQACFWSFVDRRGDDDCWLWLGPRSADGYGDFLGCSAHRFLWKLIGGAEAADGLHLHHRLDVCGNKLCVNPKHLEPLTPSEHTLRHTTEPSWGRVRPAT